MYYVYVLVSQKDGFSYIGSTNDLRRRVAQHNNGDVVSTKPRRPLMLVYYEAYTSEKDARLRESRLKKKGEAYAQLRTRIVNSLNNGL